MSKLKKSLRLRRIRQVLNHHNISINNFLDWYLMLCIVAKLQSSWECTRNLLWWTTYTRHNVENTGRTMPSCGSGSRLTLPLYLIMSESAQPRSRLTRRGSFNKTVIFHLFTCDTQHRLECHVSCVTCIQYHTWILATCAAVLGCFVVETDAEWGCNKSWLEEPYSGHPNISKLSR